MHSQQKDSPAFLAGTAHISMSSSNIRCRVVALMRPVLCKARCMVVFQTPACAAITSLLTDLILLRPQRAEPITHSVTDKRGGVKAIRHGKRPLHSDL